MQEMDLFVSSFNSFVGQLSAFVPKFLAAMLLLLLGWMLAKLVRKGVRKLLDIAHFDKLAEKSGIEEFLKHGELNVTLSGVIAEVAYWLVLLVVVVTAANSLGLAAVAGLFDKVALYLPNVVVAILVLVFGTLVARFINRLMFAWLNNLGVDGALTISTVAEYAVQVFALFVALEQLNIGAQMLTAAFIIVFGAVCLAGALAFGLGGRDWAAGVIAKLAAGKKRP